MTSVGTGILQDACIVCEAVLVVMRLHAQQLDFEDEGGIRWNHATSAACTIAQRSWNDQGAGAADLHALYAFVPAFDDVTCAERETERIVAVLARIELGASAAVRILQPARVMDGDMCACSRFCAFTDNFVFVLQTGGGSGRCHGFPLMNDCRQLLSEVRSIVAGGVRCRYTVARRR